MSEKIANTPPIDHWSHSSLGLLLRNPLAFKKKYMLKIYDSTMSPSGVMGQAAHKTVEMYLKGQPLDAATDAGLKLIDSFSDVAIDYGKTGSREKIIKDFNTAVNFYFEELPDWDKREVVYIEERLTEVIHDEDGNEMPLPAKCFVDVVWRSCKKETFAGKSYPKGTLFIEDNKFVKSFTDPDELTDPTKLRQAFFNFLILRENLGEEPAAILYREIKISKNKDGSAQCQYYVIDFNDVRSELVAFFQLYNDCTKYVMNENAIYLPNPSDMFDGKDSWLSYRDNLITADAPTVVHKTVAETKVVEKQYQESAGDKVENKDLTQEERIRLKLQEFGIPVAMKETYNNSSVTMYTLKPSRGVRMSTIEKHGKDLALALKVRSIRVQAPIMGTDTVGVEVPNENRTVVNFFDENGIPSDKVGLEKSTLNIPVGMDVYGKTISKDLREMPHLLVAGATGAGKSVMLNVILHSLMHQNTPEELKMVLIDPKRVELASFKDSPHIMTSVIHEHERAMRALKWMVDEMEVRYEQLQDAGYRNILDYNDDHAKKMPYIVVVIDEYADLMLETKNGFVEWQFCGDHGDFDRRGELTRLLTTKTKLRKNEQLLVEAVEECAKNGDGCVKHEYPPAEKLIVRLAQKARAVGIHLVLATQRPSVDVVTGLIKANLPARIAFMTTSKTDSQIVLDTAGAEELVGKGDMLFADPSKKGLQRLQGFYA